MSDADPAQTDETAEPVARPPAEQPPAGGEPVKAGRKDDEQPGDDESGWVPL
jgi:hypothetical protein